jgi:hypothetical protein
MAVRCLRQEVFLLDLRAEQLRIHLQSLCTSSPEARLTRSDLASLDTRRSACVRFLREAGRSRRTGEEAAH